MTLISDEYRDQLRQIHESRPTWGTTGPAYASWINYLFRLYECTDALDYGAGKGELSKLVPNMRNYDPVTFPELPAPADLVSITDVMEHIEPENLGSVLRHISGLIKKVGYFVIATKPAQQILPDGRNAHLIVADERFWMPHLEGYFVVREVVRKKNGLLITVEPRR